MHVSGTERQPPSSCFTANICAPLSYLRESSLQCRDLVVGGCEVLTQRRLPRLRTSHLAGRCRCCGPRVACLSP